MDEAKLKKQATLIAQLETSLYAAEGQAEVARMGLNAETQATLDLTESISAWKHRYKDAQQALVTSRAKVKELDAAKV